MMNGKPKKRLRIFLLLTLVVGILFTSVSCKKSENTAAASGNSNKKVTITFYHWGTQPQMQGNIDTFEKEYPNVTVVYHKMTDSTTQGVNLLLASGVQVDVVGESTLYDLRTREEAGMFEPLDSFIKADKIDYTKEFGSEIDNMYKMDGHYYAMPYCKSLYAMFINEDMFAKAGISPPSDNWTWDDFKADALKLTTGSGANKIYGVVPDYLGQWDFPAKEALGSNDMYKNNTDKESNYDNPAFKYSLQLLYDMEMTDKSAWPLADYKALKIDTQAYTEFFQGKVAMMPNVIADVKYVDDPSYAGANAPKFKFGVVNMPQYKSGSKLQDIYYTSDVSIPKSSKYKQEAFNFIKNFCIDRPDMIAKYKGNATALLTKNIPSSMTGSLEDDIMNHTNFDMASGKRVFFDNNPVLVQRDPFITTQNAAIQSATQNEVTSCLEGNESVAQALANMKKEADQILAKAKQP